MTTVDCGLLVPGSGSGVAQADLRVIVAGKTALPGGTAARSGAMMRCSSDRYSDAPGATVGAHAPDANVFDDPPGLHLMSIIRLPRGGSPQGAEDGKEGFALNRAIT